MGIVHKIVRWYKLTYGTGKEMCENGARIAPCPHCGNDTPVYRSSYDSKGEPLSFSVCVWCDGLIEQRPDALAPHSPYATREEIDRVNRRVKRRRRRREPRSWAGGKTRPNERGFDPLKYL